MSDCTPCFRSPPPACNPSPPLLSSLPPPSCPFQQLSGHTYCLVLWAVCRLSTSPPPPLPPPSPSINPSPPQMSRVERCQHYTTALPLEAPAVNPANPLPSTANTPAGGWMQWLAKGAAGLPLRNAPSSWPSRGTLEFREVGYGGARGFDLACRLTAPPAHHLPC